VPWSERPLTERFGVELSGLRIGPDLPQADRMVIYDSVVEHGVVVVTGQDLSDDDFFDFASSIGAVTPSPVMSGVPQGRVLPIGNVDAEGNLLPPDAWSVKQNRANELWHLDLTFMKPRATISMLFGRRCPPSGGNTEFCDLRLAYEALSAEEQMQLDPLTTSHSILHSRALYGIDEFTEEDRRRFPPTERPLVARHEENSRKALLLASHIETVSGYGREEGAALIRDLTERATVPENVYSHRWTAGDFLLWDNRSVMHRATPYDHVNQPREMRALRLYDTTDV
jgi:alpha-ketoglutarate-dependent 2,4-dichlorophenoxyacetate dioxygenase